MLLSEKQQVIVDYKDGALLVEAGPGSGKTRVLIERIKALLKNSRRGNVLALTFSNMAADEMRERLEEDESFEEHLGRVTTGTIHSFCLDLVLSRGDLIGLDSDMVLFENEEDRMAVLKNIFIENPQFLEYYIEQDKKQIMHRILQLISEKKRRFISSENCSEAAPFPSIYSEYNRQLMLQNAMDFDDILYYAYRILTENPSVTKIYNALYRYVCIDEAQDLNYAQYQVIKALCGDSFHNIMMVGDANQSIYGFNGSDSNYMTKDFVNDFSPTIYELNENYRSAKKIVAFANGLEEYNSVTNYVYEGELLAVSLNDEEMEAKYVADKIEQLMRNGHPDVEGSITFEKIAIIARNKYAFSKLEKVFENRKMPYYYKKNAIGIENESDYMKVFELAIRIIINPKDIIHYGQLTELLGISKSFINQDSGFTILTETLKDSKYENMVPSLDILRNEVFDFNTVLNTLEAFSSSLEDEERYLFTMDILQWRKHWNKYCKMTPKENRSLTSFRNQISLGKTNEGEIKKGILLLSAHMSKGLQFDVVFIMGLNEGTFPDYRAIRAGEEELSQEKNNMYVAVTRAKRLCYMTCPRKKLMPWGDIKLQVPSRYIKDIVTYASDY